MRTHSAPELRRPEFIPLRTNSMSDAVVRLLAHIPSCCDASEAAIAEMNAIIAGNINEKYSEQTVRALILLSNSMVV